MKDKIKINFIYSTMYQMLVIILPLVTTPYVSRVLGAENIGIYSYSYSVAHYFMLIAMLGTKNYGNRCIARERGNREKLSQTFINIYILQFSMTVVMLIIYFIYLQFLVKENVDIGWIQTLYLLTAAADISWFFFGLEEFKLTVLRNTAIKIIAVILVFIFVKTRDDLWKYTLIMSGSLFVGYCSLFPFLRKYINFVKPEWKEIRKHVKPNLILFIPVVAVGIFNIMDKIMLGWMSTKTQVGYYENAEKMMRIPFGVITALGNVMLPRMSHLMAIGRKEEGKNLIELSMCFIMFLACGMAAGLAGVAHVFAPLFFGTEFVASGDLLIGLAPTILFLSWANVIRTQYLIPNSMDREFTISTIIGALVNLIVNCIFIIPLGAMGAVIGTLCAEFSVTMYQTLAVREKLPLPSYFKLNIGFAANGMIMFVAIYFMSDLIESRIITLIIQIIFGFILYCLLSIFWLLLNRKNFAANIAIQSIQNIYKMILKILKMK